MKNYTQTFLPTDTVANPYVDANAQYSATLIPLDANGNPEYYYPHMTVNVTQVGPSSLSATSVSPNEIDLAWPVYSSTCTTNIYISTDGTDFSYFDTAAAGQTSYQAMGLVPGTSYTFEITALSPTDSESAASNTSAATTAIDPWNTQANGSSGILEGATYSLTLSTNPIAGAPAFGQWTVDWGDGSSDSPDVSTYTSADITATHVFATGIDSTIIDVTASTASGASDPLTVSPQSIEVDLFPLAPENVQATAFSPTEIDLSWTNMSQDADENLILRSLDGGATYQAIATVGGTDSSYDDTTLTAGASAQYCVEARGVSNTTVSSSASSTVVTTPTTSNAGEPTLSVSSPSNGSTSALLTWTYAGTDETGFEIEMEDITLGQNFYTISTPGKVDATGTGSMAVNGLVAGDTYDFRMRADHIGGTASRYVDTGAWSIPQDGAPVLRVSNWNDIIVSSFTGATVTYPRVVVGWSGIAAGSSVELDVTGSAWPGSEWHKVVGNLDDGLWSATFQEQVQNLPQDTTDQGYTVDPGVPAPGVYSFRIRSVDSSGNVSPWSQPQTSRATPDGSGASVALSGTSTTITVTWPSTGGPNFVYMQDSNNPVAVNGDGSGYITIPPAQLSEDGTQYTSTITGLTPGTTYEFVAWTQLFTRPDMDAVPDFAFAKSSFTTDGTPSAPLAPPPAPDKLWPVDLGDGVSTAEVELLWHNTPDQEDGFVVERSSDPSFSTGVARFEVPADQTNFIDSLPYPRSFLGILNRPSPPIYYRVASFRGSSISAWVNTELTPARAPVAMAVSWLSFLPAGVNVSGLEEYALDLTANPPPPPYFAFGNGSGLAGYQYWSLEAYEASMEYRNILTLQLDYSVDPYTGTFANVNPMAQQLLGYTPLYSGLHIQGQNLAAKETSNYDPSHKSFTVSVLATFRLQAAENLGFGTMEGLAGRLPHRAPYAWARITYTFNVDGTYGISFSGSAVPSQTDYINEYEVDSYAMVDAAGINAFLATPYGNLGPVALRPTTVHH